MISERRFASSHTAFWRAAMPMGESVVRSLNRSPPKFAMPVGSTSDSVRFGHISEMSLRIFEASEGVPVAPVRSEIPERLRALGAEVAQYIARLEGSGDPVAMDDDEIREALVWSSRLVSFIRSEHPNETTVTRPQFPGCGFLGACEGDLLVGTTLYEIKNVERTFRLTDWRQLVIYAALNSLGRVQEVNTIALLNVRLGLYCKVGLNDFCIAAAGVEPSALFSDIADYLSRLSVSN